MRRPSKSHDRSRRPARHSPGGLPDASLSSSTPCMPVMSTICGGGAVAHSETCKDGVQGPAPCRVMACTASRPNMKRAEGAPHAFLGNRLDASTGSCLIVALRLGPAVSVRLIAWDSDHFPVCPGLAAAFPTRPRLTQHARGNVSCPKTLGMLKDLTRLAGAASPSFICLGLASAAAIRALHRTWGVPWGSKGAIHAAGCPSRASHGSPWAKYGCPRRPKRSEGALAHRQPSCERRDHADPLCGKGPGGAGRGGPQLAAGLWSSRCATRRIANPNPCCMRTPPPFLGCTY